MECVHRTPLPRHPRYENLEVARQRRRLHHDLLQKTGTPPCLQVGSSEPSAPTSSDLYFLYPASVVADCAPILHEKMADPETPPLPPARPMSARWLQSPRLDFVTGTAM